MSSLTAEVKLVDTDGIEALRADVVGRERELELILAAVNTGRDLLLEGPPGTSKTTLLKAITRASGIPLMYAEGNAELTPGRLLGHHDPARVLQEGYSDDTFEPGPLVAAMRAGGFLYFEEFNRAPEDTLNSLLTAIADRRLTLPRVGTIVAEPTFRLIGSMNPFDNVGTTRLSVSIRDRLNRLVIGYQDASSEREIVRLRGQMDEASPFERRLVGDAVEVVRRTREHDALKQGSSIRGAIDLCVMARELCGVRGVAGDDEARYRDAFLETMLFALSGRIVVDHASGSSAEAILREIWENHFLLARAPSGENPVGVEAANGFAVRKDESDRGRPPFKRQPKQLTSEPGLMSGSGGQGLAAGPRVPAADSSRRRPGRTGFGDEDSQLDGEEGEQPGPNEAVQRRANEIAARLAATNPPRMRRARRGGNEALAVSYNGAGDEVDLDRTLDALAERRPLGREDVIVRERRRTSRSIVLAVDVSGSMRDERLLTAAATVGALSSFLVRDDLAVIAFWSDAAVLLRLGERAPLDRLVDEMLGLQACGLTNVAFPLEHSRQELGGDDGREQRVLLLSDCVHNAGPDPRGAAGRLPRVDVLFDTAGERDPELAGGIARAGHGFVLPITSYRDVAPAVSRALARSQ